MTDASNDEGFTTKEILLDLKAEVKANAAENQRAHDAIVQNIAGMKADFVEKIAEVKGEIAEVKADFVEKIAEVKGEIAEVRGDLKALRTGMKTFAWCASIGITAFLTCVQILVALFLGGNPTAQKIIQQVMSIL